MAVINLQNVHPISFPPVVLGADLVCALTKSAVWLPIILFNLILFHHKIMPQLFNSDGARNLFDSRRPSIVL